MCLAGAPLRVKLEVGVWVRSGFMSGLRAGSTVELKVGATLRWAAALRSTGGGAFMGTFCRPCGRSPRPAHSSGSREKGDVRRRRLSCALLWLRVTFLAARQCMWHVQPSNASAFQAAYFLTWHTAVHSRFPSCYGCCRPYSKTQSLTSPDVGSSTEAS
jgi:hypothetical protein